MRSKTIITTVLLIFCVMVLPARNVSSELNLKISIAEKIQKSFKSKGRLFIYLSQKKGIEPRRQAGINTGSYVFAKNIKQWQKKTAINTSALGHWMKTSDWDLNATPNGTYFVQVLWDQDNSESRSNAPGNIFSKPVKVTLDGSKEIALVLSEIIPPRKLVKHKLVRLFKLKSMLLSTWWKKTVELKTAILLPAGYEAHPEKRYPVRYNIAGYGGRYTRVNHLVGNKTFMGWWTSGNAPQIITVFLDGEGHFGDCYQLNSENNGPYGDALINELIPAIEKKFRVSEKPELRFVDGCSTGGWVSLALQLFYPNTFNGCWSYSPDPVDFHWTQLINIYDDANAFYGDNNLIRPSMRSIYGEPKFSIKQEVTSENVQGYSNTFVTSGEQWGAWNALFSPRGVDGLPRSIFDAHSGVIDKEVAEHWKKYDLLLYLKRNWTLLGPKLQGKLHLWMGDMDNFYLNNALRNFKVFLDGTRHPASNAEIIFTPMKGHCANYSQRDILEKIAVRIGEIEKNKTH